MNEKKRYKLAMELNNIIAAPSFQSWLNGEPLDIHNLMYQPNGRPRVSIFYTAHLNDTERMFITTLILESIIGWMRMESGTPSLRAILYIDELFGYHMTPEQATAIQGVGDVIKVLSAQDYSAWVGAEQKKMAAKMSRTGVTRCSIVGPSPDSAISDPAMKAPSATE